MVGVWWLGWPFSLCYSIAIDDPSPPCSVAQNGLWVTLGTVSSRLLALHFLVGISLGGRAGIERTEDNKVRLLSPLPSSPSHRLWLWTPTEKPQLGWALLHLPLQSQFLPDTFVVSKDRQVDGDQITKGHTCYAKDSNAFYRFEMDEEFWIKRG